MPKLDEYYQLLRTQEPPLTETALRASIRAAVERVHAEGIAQAASETVSESLTEISSEAASNLAASGVASSVETGTTLATLGGISPIVAPLLAGVAFVGVIVLGIVLWRVTQQRAADAISPQPNAGLFSSKNTNQQVLLSPSGSNTTNSEVSGKMPQVRNASGVSNGTSLPIYDNTEELIPSSPDLQTTHDSKVEQPFDVEANEQERYRDSLQTLSQLPAKKRDAARQRQHDLLLRLVQNARDHIVSPHQYTLKGAPCSLPAALRSETSVECMLLMLEQQSILMQDPTLTYLAQQARRDKVLSSLSALELYIKEHW